MAPSRGWIRHPVTATILGIVVAVLTVMLAEKAGHALLGVGATATPRSITTGQFVAVYVAWILGAAVGALVATRWARTRSIVPGMIVGAFVLLGAAATFTMILHPTWMVVGSVALPIVGALIARYASGPGATSTGRATSRSSPR